MRLVGQRLVASGKKLVTYATDSFFNFPPGSKWSQQSRTVCGEWTGS